VAAPRRTSVSGFNHYFDRFKVIHAEATVRYSVETDRLVKDSARLNASFKYVWEQLVDVSAHGPGVAVIVMFL
jgi:hypothetical protein